ncbi:MAG TPA: glycosyl transferase [Cyanobacteria bacterium UBA8803]|nr:glycosyl transferase [Cyanobacteria bacterium UBA9273]HBL60381.1 glycosyl transferase [Cyanobacteria bacterium UBA8803]
MIPTAAVLYKSDGYNTSSKRLLGRQAAGEGFLKGLVEFGRAEGLYCYAATATEFREFCQRIQPWLQRPRQVQWLNAADPKTLAQPGAIYNPDPNIAKLVWQRRFTDQRSYSVCGITHTIASMGALQNIGDVLIAPVQPWDALICTSRAVKTAVEHLLDTWAEYLAQRTGGKPNPNIQLPIIPLGVDCNSFAQLSVAPKIRQQLRQLLGIAPNDIVILFIGRLCFYAKAHPIPMYLALEKAVQTTQVKVHLIQAGWFEDTKEELSFKESAKIFCPSVNSIFLDGREPQIRSSIWSAADIFISLADNIQETFGLTPIEAMAAGLPVIVSDWNGYQESVRHEVDGFRIPTLTPPPESGLDLAFDYLAENLNYSTYIGHASMAAAVDIAACARALTMLIEDSQLRQQMGESGKQRARELYDWQVAIAAYENLWQELAEIRAAASLSVPVTAGMPPHPLYDDPFRFFAHYPTASLTKDSVLKLGAMSQPEHLNQLRQLWITNFGANRRTPTASVDIILADIQQEGCQSVAEILNRHGGENSAELLRTLVYLVKFDILQVGS